MLNENDMKMLVKLGRGKRYRTITKTEAEQLAFHNLKRLMNKVRANIGFWENTDPNWSDHWENPEQYTKMVKDNLANHREFFAMLREVSMNHPHKDSPKLKRDTNGA